MISSNSFIVYSLLKDVTTQKIKGKNVNDVFRNISDFLINCTDANPEKPSSIEITSYSAYNDNDDPKIAKQIFADLTILFGEGETAPLTYNYPSGIPSANTKTEWEIDSSQLENALKYMTDGKPWPKYTFGPVELLITYFFNLIDPVTKEILPNQADNSHLMIWFSRTFSCSPTLFFPFETAGETFDVYLKKIEPSVPFELKHKYLRHARANKSKTGFIYKKL